MVSGVCGRASADVGPCTVRGHLEAQGITVVGAIGEQHAAAAERIKHVGGAPAIVRLSGSELERDRHAVRIDQRVGLGGQSTARAPPCICRQAHAPGAVSGARPFLPLASCL